MVFVQITLGGNYTITAAFVTRSVNSQDKCHHKASILLYMGVWMLLMFMLIVIIKIFKK